MEKAKLDFLQFFSLIVLFELGSTLVIGMGTAAKQDAWLTILVGLAGGVLLFLFYSALFRRYPDLPITGIAQKVLGKPVGTLLGYLYVVYFMYVGARILLDFGILSFLSTLDQTPFLVIMTLMILVIIYVLYLGVEVLGRLGEMFLLAYLLVSAFGALLLLFSGLVDLAQLRPVLEEGWTPVLKTALQTFTFPFGEMIVFMMLFPYLNRPKSRVKVGLSGMVFSGAILCVTSIITTAVLGADIADRSTFPLLTMIGKVNIAEIFQNLDVIAVLILIIVGFFKIAIFFYAALIGLADLTKVHKNRLVYPMGMTILFLSIIIADDFVEHFKEGLAIVPIYLHLPFQTGIPLILLAVSLFRHRKGAAGTG
ncbi:spore germination protein KB [Marinithermofilum abyssi]|uniref:Spore germination protein KB n=1 Tax=Marinithermofilum abyssi TaxID=1571185 RepID=A0A8J2VDQ1_9BACL|nr:endospore germination permease [Marinithermofilum abyssi]GGE15643.1 spore germination protein KB [Marinithermofilum abyssi]